MKREREIENVEEEPAAAKAQKTEQSSGVKAVVHTSMQEGAAVVDGVQYGQYQYQYQYQYPYPYVQSYGQNMAQYSMAYGMVAPQSHYTPQHVPQPPPGSSAAAYAYVGYQQQMPYDMQPTTWFCAFCSSTNQLSDRTCPNCGSSGASQGAFSGGTEPKVLKTNPNLPKLSDLCKFFHGPKKYCARGEDCRFAH